MIKIGVFGAGHLGKIHLKLLKQIPAFDLVGFYDPSPEQAAFAAKEYRLTAFESPEALLDVVDAVDIVTPTLTHYDLAVLAVRRFKHVFLEKPITETYEQARSLSDLIREAGVRGMVGHVERYNPAILALQGRKIQPLYIQIDRLAQYNPRGTDVSVVHDLMIHDLDLALHLVGSNIKRISASGTPIISATADVANARIEFHNGCVAQIATSRVAFGNLRRVQIFQAGEFYDLDLLNKIGARYTMHATEAEAIAQGVLQATYMAPERAGYVGKETLLVQPINAIERELSDFAMAIETGNDPAVTVYQAADALHAVEQIVEKLQNATM